MNQHKVKAWDANSDPISRIYAIAADADPFETVTVQAGDLRALVAEHRSSESTRHPPAPAESVAAFLDAIKARSPNGERVEVQYHPDGDWSVFNPPAPLMSDENVEKVADAMITDACFQLADGKGDCITDGGPAFTVIRGELDFEKLARAAIQAITPSETKEGNE